MNNLDNSFFINFKDTIKSKTFTAIITLYASYFIIFKISIFQVELLILEIYLPNYNEYLELIISGIKIMLGLVIVITGFYLGRSHDYKRDYIIKSAEYFETQLRITLFLSKIKINFEFDEKIKDYIKKELKLNFSDVESLKKFLMEGGKDIVKNINEVEKQLKKIPLIIITMSSMTTILLATILVYSTISQKSEDPASFFIVIGGLTFTIITFIFIWIFFERTVAIHDVGLRFLVRGNGTLKVTYDYLKDVLDK